MFNVGARFRYHFCVEGVPFYIFLPDISQLEQHFNTLKLDKGIIRDQNCPEHVSFLHKLAGYWTIRESLPTYISELQRSFLTSTMHSIFIACAKYVPFFVSSHSQF